MFSTTLQVQSVHWSNDEKSTVNRMGPSSKAVLSFACAVVVCSYAMPEFRTKWPVQYFKRQIAHNLATKSYKRELTGGILDN